MTNIQVLKGDITQLQADAIVNAANASLLGGGGVDGAIHRAGGPAILNECRRIAANEGGCPTGHAVATTAGNLPAKMVIHTVGPVWHGGQQSEDSLLTQCYLNSLKLACQSQIKSIVFPCISTGIYHFPKARAARIAIESVNAYVKMHPDSFTQITFVCFDQENMQAYEDIFHANMLEPCLA